MPLPPACGDRKHWLALADAAVAHDNVADDCVVIDDCSESRIAVLTADSQTDTGIVVYSAQKQQEKVVEKKKVRSHQFASQLRLEKMSFLSTVLQCFHVSGVRF